MLQQRLPELRGPLSEWLLDRLRHARCTSPPTVRGSIDVLDSDDAQLALHCIYELAYRGFEGVDDRLERDPAVLRLGGQIEAAMEGNLRERIGPLPQDPRPLLIGLASSSGGPSLSGFMRERADRRELCELMIHRSAYQLKEADPHSWGLPRLSGRAKAAMVEIQFDEYGSGRPGRSHAELFASTMGALGLDPTYGRYLNRLPATTLATGNLISMFGLQRRLLPALIGHLALFEMTSTGPMQRYSDALGAVEVGPEGREFFDVHVVADAHHSVLALEELVGGLLDDDPGAGAEISFGALALAHVEGAFSTSVMESFSSGTTSLYVPVATLDAPSVEHRPVGAHRGPQLRQRAPQEA